MNCYRHPERVAKRKCYFCQKPICPQCQVRLDHHIFCSESCHQSWLEEKKKKALSKTTRRTQREKISELEQKLAYTFSRHLRLEEKILQLQTELSAWRKKAFYLSFLVFFSALAVVLVVFGYGFHSFKNSHLSDDNFKFDPGYPASLEEPKYLETPQLELAPGTITVKQERIDLYGRAPGASSVVLLVNGREEREAEVEGEEFVFKEVKLFPGANVLQVIARDDENQTSLSPAQLIEYQGRNQARVAYTPGLNYSRGSRDLPYLAITFDAGGEASYAQRVLEILKQRNIKTTIFVTGRFIEKYPQLVRKMVEDGQEVGNHTYSHPHLTTWEENHRHLTRPGVSREFLQKELLLTAELFRQTTGKEMAPFWRAPYGEHNREIRRWAEEVGFYHIDWSREPGRSYDTLDWLSDESSKHYRSPQEIRKMLVELDGGVLGKANGAIILMHLSTARGKNFPQQVLAPALDALLARGYQIVPVSELFPELAGR